MPLRIKHSIRTRKIRTNNARSRRFRARKRFSASSRVGHTSFKRAVFPQTRVKPNFSTRYSILRKEIKSHDDAATFYMLADATCAKKPKADIERVFVNVFKPSKIATATPKIGNLESLEILMDGELMQEIRESKKDADEGRVISWDELKIMA